MYLKRLELQGFKTFANRTEFEFGSGITAIIGPNGSGKSNVADAVRWVLGEQSGRLLRTKKTEDVIFAGSSLRSPAGMSEVTLTLDNSSGWLPVDFSEITVGRRVYRSGDSEYLINRGKVRLKDITDLLMRGSVGQNTYSVIGQGMVDSALSLRPEERKGLLDEAANTKRYHNNIAEARTKLEATIQNLARARDIVSEIGPRLSRLQKQALQAAEYEELTRELSSLLTSWYYQSWQKAVKSLITTRQQAAICEHELSESREELARVALQIDETREGRRARRSETGAWQKEQAAISGKLDRTNRQLAVSRERLASFSQLRHELVGEIESLNSSYITEGNALSEARERLIGLSRDHSLAQAQLALAQTELNAQNASQAELHAQLSRLQEKLLAASSSLADSRNRLVQLDERDAKLANEAQRLRVEAERLQALAETCRGRQMEFQTHMEAHEQESAALAVERDRILQTARERRERMRAVEAELSEAMREMARLQSQYDTLSKLQDSHSSLYAGVRTVLHAAKVASTPSSSSSGRGDRAISHSAQGRRDASVPLETQLPGVVGIVASIVEVPRHLEVAIEVSLGGHLQDIVVEKWAHAERAIELLKATKGGRATFLPLETVRGGRVPSVPSLPGVIGLASDLVGYDDRFRNVVAQLLGQTIVVEDLGVARRLLGENGKSGALTGGQIVTLAGEIARPNGSLTGGSTRLQAEGTLLARQRELRELPKEIGRAAVRQSELENRLEAERAAEQKMAVDLAELEKKERRLAGVRQGLSGEMSKLQRELDRLRQEASWQKDLGRQADDERKESQSKRQDLSAKLAEAERTGEETRSALASLQRDAEDLLRARANVHERFNELRTTLAVMDRATGSERSLVASHEQSLQRLEAQKEAKQERVRSLDLERSQLQSEVEFLEREIANLDRQAEAIAACIEPALIRLSELDAEEGALLAEETRLKSKALEAERRTVQANLSVQRQEEDMASLRERMESEGVDLQVEATFFSTVPDMVNQPRQLSMALREPALTTAGPAAGSPSPWTDENMGDSSRSTDGEFLSGAADLVLADPAALKRRIDRLRSRLRGIGPVNTTAIEEYEEVKGRYDFLETQISDLTRSEQSLREAIDLLEAQAMQQFDSVFEAVGREFSRYFAQLFGGGTAKLVKSEDGDVGTSGVDIIAHPPGKRVQGLSSFSGGERALTAIALLFAILTVNPAPFCVLDEVDAALDENNVSRFLSALRQLSKRTQFIVITHNRGTVELADTLFGISLGSDNVSRTISLKMEDRIKAES